MSNIASIWGLFRINIFPEFKMWPNDIFFYCVIINIIRKLINLANVKNDTSIRYLTVICIPKSATNICSVNYLEDVQTLYDYIRTNGETIAIHAINPPVLWHAYIFSPAASMHIATTIEAAIIISTPLPWRGMKLVHIAGGLVIAWLRSNILQKWDTSGIMVRPWYRPLPGNWWWVPTELALVRSVLVFYKILSKHMWLQ